MPSDPQLRFIENTANEGEGLSDAGIETYRDDPFPAVARETAQNSRDAHDESANPVRIEFKQLLIPRNCLPDADSFLARAQDCLKAANADQNEKEIAFFEQAVEILQSDEIPVLEVADYNTKGLEGPCRQTPPTAFYALVKSSGSSVKEGHGAGGSFGIGKSAVYSASDLQTVFYATRYRSGDDGDPKYLCQGKTKFRSHSDSNGNSNRSTGYWGISEGFLPIDNPGLAPKWARRTEIGTSVFSIGMRSDADWQRKMIASIVVNFFGAINGGKMVFRVEDQEINKDTLPSLFEDSEIRNCALTVEDFDLSKIALECLNSSDATQNMIGIENLGLCRLRVLVRDGLPKTVIFLRNGMKICTKLDHFGDKLARFPLHKDFIAILEPAENQSSEWMRRLENPRHDELSPERPSKESDRVKARSEGAALAGRIRAVIGKEAKAIQGNRSQIEELGQFFADDIPREEDPIGQRGLQTTKVIPVKPTKQRVVKQLQDPPGKGEEGGQSTRHNGGGAGGNGSGSGVGNGAGEGGTGNSSSKRNFPLSAVRTIMDDLSTPNRRKVFFTPQQDGKASLRFRSSGLSDSEDLPLASEGKHLEIECIADQRLSLDVEFEEPYTGPIEVISWTVSTNDSVS